MNFHGVLIGAGTFVMIGIFHPIVIKAEYYFGTKVWPVFLIAGLACVCASLLITHLVASSLLGILGFTCLWSIPELVHQAQRVKKGWFPKNPRRTY